jgi:hypothetical protein
MKAFHNYQKVKDKYLSRVIAHRKADEIIQGTYWKDGKGCAVGCTIHGDNHKSYEVELGIPEWLARLEDKIFEGMSIERSKSWPQEFLEAINVGADLNKIKIPFLIFIVESARENFNHKEYPKVLAAIDGVLTGLKRDTIDFEKLKVARRAAAYAAAAYAAAAAADAAYAAAAAADAAYAAAAYAAYAAAAAAAADAAYAAAAARRKTYEKFADKLLELLRTSKP